MRQYKAAECSQASGLEFVFELIIAMCAVSVIPDGAMRAHDDHAVNKCCQQHPQAKKFEDKQ